MTEAENTDMPIKQDQERIARAESSLENYLTGYLRGSLIRAEEILQLYDWREHAQQELKKRQHQLISLLDLETLTAIANGEINIHEITRRVQAKKKELAYD